MKKYENGPNLTLGDRLYCTRKDNSSNWSATACATIKLLPFSDGQQAVKHNIPPHIFDRFIDNFGTNTLIQWSDLFNGNNDYVKDDTINLEVKIEAENPNRLNNSILKFECIDCCCQATFQLTVVNVSNLMAVQSLEFIMRGLPWRIMILQNATHLGIRLKLMEHSGNVSYEVIMSVKLVSTKENQPMAQDEKVSTKKMKWPGNLYIGNMISWNELFKPENGYVNNDSITLKLK